MLMINWLFYLPDKLSAKDQAYWDAVNARDCPLPPQEDIEQDIYREYVFDNETITEFPK